MVREKSLFFCSSAIVASGVLSKILYKTASFSPMPRRDKDSMSGFGICFLLLLAVIFVFCREIDRLLAV